jgi:hypothetical protein
MVRQSTHETRVLTQIKKAAYSAALQLRGKDLNLRPLGYAHNLMMAGPFVSKHFVATDVRFYPLFSNFCEHFVSIVNV